jgi:2-(1,2-epoxy-1,2-dihydrophenyl)acetyl-CoA isomerase
VDLEKMDGIDVELRQHVLTVTINRPERRNSCTPDQMNHIGKACAAAELDDEVRVVVLRGVGDAFCTGADLGETDLSASGGQMPPVTMGQNLFLSILDLSKPLVAVVNGVAAGGGLSLALCCDIRIASTNARFSTSFTRIGITTNDALAYLLPRTVGIAKALELIYIPRPIDAAEAERIGLVSYVKPAEELEPFVDHFVAEIASGPPVGVRFSKRLVIDGLARTYREHVVAQEYASLANRVLADHDVREGIAAFKEKRSPDFRGIVATRRWQNY